MMADESIARIDQQVIASQQCADGGHSREQKVPNIKDSGNLKSTNFNLSFNNSFNTSFATNNNQPQQVASTGKSSDVGKSNGKAGAFDTDS